jgi:hypothetical protein
LDEKTVSLRTDDGPIKLKAMANKILTAEILKVVENQIRDNKPPETKQTYNRLIKMGISDINARKYIGQCVAVEIYNVMKHHKLFDEERYRRNLEQLPEEPIE